MSGLVAVFLIWCCFAVPIGWAFAKMESKVNGIPMRTKSAILLSVFLGPIGWVILAARSGMKFAGGIRTDLRAQGDAARQALASYQQMTPQGPPNPQYLQQPTYPPSQQYAQQPPYPAVQQPPTAATPPQ